MHVIWQDLKYGLRLLARSPGFAAVAIVTLALGIGANTGIFSVVYAALLRQLPYAQPNRLITLSELRDPSDQYWDVSYPDYLDWQKQAKSFISLAGFSNDAFVFHGAGQPEILPAAQATTNFFSTLGVRPMLGRDFAAGDDVVISGDASALPKVALLTYGFWRTHFGADPGIVGRSMQLDSSSVTVIGVLPRDFEFAPTGGAQIWVPLHISDGMAARRSLRWMSCLGRLASGVTEQQARSEMDSVTAQLAAAYPNENAAILVRMIPLRERIIGQIQALLWILFVAVGFVLLIACANVANLLMVRASGRRREFAVRAALGATRRRLLSQMLTESLILSLAGGAGGFLAARWGTAALVAAIPQQLASSMPFLQDTGPNTAILMFLCGIAVLTGVLFGLAPALQVSHKRVSDALKEETRTAVASGNKRLRDVLVVVEVAFSLVLLAGAGLAVRSLYALLHRDPGFDTRNLLTFGVGLPENSYPKDPDAIRFELQFRRRLGSVPGIVGIGDTSVVPLTNAGNTVRFVIEGRPVRPGHEDECLIRDVSPGYFSTLKIPLIAGRFFEDAADSDRSPKHAIVNQAWVKRFLHGENAIGRRFKFTMSATQPYREIVGVVGTIADSQLDSAEEPALFLPFTQDANPYMNFVVRTAGNPVVALGQARGTLSRIDPQLFPVQPLTMDQIIDQSPSVFLRRYPSYLVGSFAALALLLATLGLYGLISYSVAERTREIGVRIALGAQQEDVLGLVLSHGLRLAAIGVVVGMVAALALTQLMSGLLYGVRASDPVTFFGVAILLTLVSLLACYLPARRALRVDPMVALRYE
ncbi:MAG TPA: ABC transporter permease [Candidatus Cybelea sp.]|nr:ABC transporter permease [Candidatus Cybelea sp.]